MSTEWFEGRSTEEAMERCYWRRVGFAVFLAAVLLMILWPLHAGAEPIYQAGDGTMKITLHSEPCELKEVSNLPQRATWDEPGKHFEGCWAHRDGIVVFYFLEDRSVGHAPAQVFQRVQGV